MTEKIFHPLLLDRVFLGSYHRRIAAPRFKLCINVLVDSSRWRLVECTSALWTLRARPLRGQRPGVAEAPKILAEQLPLVGQVGTHSGIWASIKRILDYPRDRNNFSFFLYNFRYNVSHFYKPAFENLSKKLYSNLIIIVIILCLINYEFINLRRERDSDLGL